MIKDSWEKLEKKYIKQDTCSDASDDIDRPAGAKKRGLSSWTHPNPNNKQKTDNHNQRNWVDRRDWTVYTIIFKPKYIFGLILKLQISGKRISRDLLQRLDI